jgi:hypothetical protein
MNLSTNGIKEWWKRVKTTARFRSILLYIAFVAIAAVFWFVFALNDNVQQSFDVNLRLKDVPDSITFISDIPDKLHVTVRDKGTGLLRNAVLKRPAIEIDFKEYTSASGSVLSVSKSDLAAMMKKTFGASAQIVSTSLDSLHLTYTDRPGKRVPIVVRTDVTATSGYVIGGHPRLSQGYTLVYGPQEALDTITRVYTDRIVRRRLSEPTTVEARLRHMPGTRLIPDKVKVAIPVEPLVNKHQMVGVTVINIHDGGSVLLFPQKVEVSYYVPMSSFNEPQTGIEVVADYSSRGPGISGRIPVRIQRAPKQCVNLSLHTDSLEYTVVR